MKEAEVEGETFYASTASSGNREGGEQPSFDFTLNEEKIEPAKPVETKIEDEANDFEEAIAESVQADEDYDDGASSNSLNQSLRQDELSLRKKLQNSPIADIKSHISIAKKFEYISIMFEGNSADYDEAILLTRYAGLAHWRASRAPFELGGNGPDAQALAKAHQYRQSVTLETSFKILNGKLADNGPYHMPAVTD
mgnify:CR=1 FL=1